MAGLTDPSVLARLLLREGVDEVVGHALEGDEHFLASVDDEVATSKKRDDPKSQLAISFLFLANI